MKYLVVFDTTIIMDNAIQTATQKAGQRVINEARNMIFEGVPALTGGVIMSMEETMGGRILDEAKAKRMDSRIKYVKATVTNVIQLAEDPKEAKDTKDTLGGADIMTDKAN